MDADRLLDLERGLPVTPADVEALRRLRTNVPSWFSLDWQQIVDVVGPGALDRRPLAEDSWTPFSFK